MEQDDSVVCKFHGSSSFTVLDFLSKYKVDNGKDFTHTSMAKPFGCFYIPFDKLDRFYELYRKAYIQHMDLYITEKPRHISPILIDIDLRFEKEEFVHRYNEQDIVDICNIYSNAIFEAVSYTHLTLPTKA